jgi:TonB family protein
MKFKKNQSLWTSLILHLTLLIAFFLVTIVEAFLPKEKAHIFEIVSPPSSQNSPALIESPPRMDFPAVMPMADLPDPVRPDPVTPQPDPVPVKPVVRPEPKLVSAADFFKDNPRKPVKPRRVQPTQAYVAPTINTDKIQKALQENLPTQVHNPSGQLTATELTALNRYGAQLNSRLNRAWIKPSNLAGVELTVTVVFDVSRSGQISNIRLRPGSGNSSFDRSVTAAFKRVGSGGITPTGEAHCFTMSFKMVD